MAILNTHGAPSNDRRVRRLSSINSRAVANAYNHVGGEYGSYADGEGLEKSSTTDTNRFAHGDAIVWEMMCRTIDELRSIGVRARRILDAGCGPGTWVSRIAEFAYRVGLGIDAVVSSAPKT